MKWIVWKDLRGKWINVGTVYGDCKTVAITRSRIFGRDTQVQSQLSHDADGGLYEKLCRDADNESIVIERRVVPRPQPFIERRSSPPRATSMPLQAIVKS